MIQEEKAYRIVNFILAGVICLIFFYSAIFSYKKENHPIPSFHTLLAGEETLSTGLSRSFSAIVRLEFDIAHQFNPYGLRVFLFFLEQFILRFIAIMLVKKTSFRLTTIVLIDVILASVLFLVHFKPFILDTFYR